MRCLIQNWTLNKTEINKTMANTKCVKHQSMGTRMTLTKKNYSKLYYTSKLWYYGTLIYYGKLWYYGKNYGTMDKTMVLY